MRSIIDETQMAHVFDIKGHPSWSFLTIADQPGATSFAIKTWLMQEWHQRGILSYGTHNLNLSHSEADIAALLDTYRALFPQLRDLLAAGTLMEALRCPPLEPLFKVR